jgi:AraC-like DNA-binding protein
MTALPEQMTVRPHQHGADVLCDALDSLQLAGALFLRGEFSSPWALASSESEVLARVLEPGSRSVILFHVVLGGRFVVSLGSTEEELQAGDVAILPSADRHVLRSPAKARLVPFEQLLPPRPWTHLPLIRHGGGGAVTSIACGYLYRDDLHLSPVLAAMPPLIVVRPREQAFREWITTNVRFALAETERRTGDHDLLMRRLPELLFLKCLDVHARDHATESAGWLAATADPIVGRALAAIHRQPERPWTLQTLARSSGTSRSVLDERFHRLLGCAPMQYLTSWRLQLAARKLRTSADSVAQIADSVGYGAIASFSRAFKRHVGLSPQAWRSQRKAG